MTKNDDLEFVGRMVSAVITLKSARGRLFLDCHVPLPGSDWSRALPVRVDANTSADAAGFFADVASAWNQVVPAKRGLATTLVLDWESQKLTLEDEANAHAEVYLNLHSGGSPGAVFSELGHTHPITLVDKDESQRAEVLRLLVEATRVLTNA